ncbi:MAG: hypothetical protein ACOZAR_00490 [Patescibacteria group bacterium]
MIEKIKYYILEGTYEIKFIKNFRRFQGLPIKGFIEPDTDTILINDSLDEPEKIITIIHEFIHEIQPGWSENKVEKTSQAIYKSMLPADKIFFQKIIKK